MRKYKGGIPAINLPKIDPLRIPSIELAKDNGGPVSTVLKLNDVDLFGMSKATMTSISGYTERPTETVTTLKIPKIVLRGKYKIRGRILVLPIKGDGKTNMTLENLSIKMVAKTKLETRDGEEYLQFKKLTMSMTHGRVRFYFENLFGDPQFSDSMNAFMNENYEVIMREKKAVIEEAFGKVFLKAFNDVYSSMPYREMYV
jgi:hypothetical protein